MIDLVQAEVQATSWGIPLRDWMELQVHVFGGLDAFGSPELIDDAEEEWRGKVAQVLIDNNLPSKANRFLECCRYAYLYECTGVEHHPLFSPIYCDLRFCPYCAPRQFARLIEKYTPILQAVTAQRKKGFRLREVTLTTRNTGALSAAQIKQFNLDVKQTLKYSCGAPRIGVRSGVMKLASRIPISMRTSLSMAPIFLKLA
jgi:hypothetical protein